MKVFIVLYLTLFLLFRADCEDGDLDSIIKEVFDTHGKDEGRNEPSGNLKDYRDPVQCICVPYYLCMNNTLVTDGTGVIDIRSKQSSCPSYLDVCCEKPLDDNQRITPAPTVREGCGKRNPEGIGFRITGDEDGEAQFGEFPWMVAVLNEENTPERTLNVYQCGGALIHPEVVLTSAHCVSNREKIYKIRAGEWDTQTSNELFPHQDAGVRKIVIHPNYHSGPLHYDMALLFLDSPVTLAENIDTVCLPRQDENFDYSRCFASGWGRDVFGKEGKYQVILKKVELPIVPRRDCELALRGTRLGPYFNLHHSFVCAGGEAGRDTCKGDGGSPLVCPIHNTKNRFVQVGIVAWGINCGERGVPGVYANVASVRDWIDEQLLYNNLSTKYYEF